MKKPNPKGDSTIEPFPGNTHDKACISEEGGPPGRPSAKPSSDSSWTARLQRRWKTMLEWLAKGAEHACPT